MRAAAALAALGMLAAALAGCTGPPPAASPGGNASQYGEGSGTAGQGGPGPGTPPASGTDGGSGAAPAAGNPVVVMTTSKGVIRLELYKDRAPITAGNFLNLTGKGFYDGTRFHRVIGPAKSPPDGFMIQDGDPNSKDPAKKSQWGQGGPGYTIKDEFQCADGTFSYALPAQCDQHGGLKDRLDKAGILAMANTGRPGSGGSQYFITLAATSWLDGRHAIFGRVIGGMDVVKAIGGVATDSGDRPTTDVVIESVKVEGA